MIHIVQVHLHLQHFGDLAQIGNILVQHGSGIQLKDIGEDDPTGNHRRIENTADPTHNRGHVLAEPLAVLPVHQPIGEYSRQLAIPQLPDRLDGVGGLWSVHEHTLEYLTDIAKIERVVELAGSGQQLSRYELVELQGRHGKLLTALPHLVYEGVVVQEALEDALEYLLHVGVGGLRHAQHQEVPQESLGELITTSSGGGTAGNQRRIHYILPV